MNGQRKINRIILHCSASDFGDVEIIRLWHKRRGFDDIGYHYVILNGEREPFSVYNEHDDGIIELGRLWWKMGAHTKSHNYDSLGICLIGSPTFIGPPERWFTPRQLQSLRTLVKQLLNEFKLSTENVYSHNDFSPKLCPGFKAQLIRSWWE